MISSILSVAAVIAALICCQTTTFGQQIRVYFSPRGGTADAIVAEIAKAHKEIRVAAYAISHPQITDALADAHARGVFVRIIVDRHQTNDSYTTANKLHDRGIRTLVDRAEKLHHNKTIIIDADTIITGSYNFTRNAEYQNAETCLIIHDAKLTTQFIANWQFHWDHSDTYKVRHHHDFTPRNVPPSLHLSPRTPRKKGT
jgi:phosphatidylserine/phosphatidylglycerophosphate/cardiolipin synthase-like enzyme